ncbi:MAG TPA: hypothetical protein VJM09_12450 [Sphingobium sp.]|nr:hypothetical protein [Sphingobium sp.]
MQRFEDRDERMKSRLLFLAALWIAISVALFSALAPLGPPSSRLTGSAFNPATTTVVLKARAPVTPPGTEATEPDGGGLARSVMPDLVWLLHFAPLLAVLGLIYSAGPYFGRRTVSPALLVTRGRRARAPPAFF